MPEMLEEQGTSVAPECWNLPDKPSYFSCRGTHVQKPNSSHRWWRKEPEPKPEVKGWLLVYYTKDEAEAHAATKHASGWVWDGEPATEIPLEKTMFEARRDGNPGVGVLSWQNGGWTTIKEYKATEPLQEAQNG